MKTKLMMTAIASIAAMSATSANAQCVPEFQKEVVYYNFNSAQSAEVQTQMDKIVNLATTCNVRSIQVTCHTDTTGSAVYNQDLSERRAADVLSVLVSRGVPRAIISSAGMGETSLMVPTGDGVKEQLNRRCEIDIQLEPTVVENYVDSYTQPAQTYTETVVEEAPYVDPTPIEPVVTEAPAPYVDPAPVYTTPTPSTPYVPPASPPPLPPVSTGGGFLGGISTPVLVGGLAAVVATGILIADDNELIADDNEPSSP